RNLSKPVLGADALADEQTIKTQQEISALNSAVGVSGSGKDSLVIASSDDMPSEGEFVYYEDVPVPVTRVEPAYPEFAREAQIQGKATLNVIGGQDGSV